MLLNKIKNIDGDIIELGVYKGQNTYIIGDFIKNANLKKRYVGFDTFEGYTEQDILESKNPTGLLDNQNSGRWNISKTLVTNEINNRKLNNHCEIVVGDIKNTIHQYLDSVDKNYKISMMYIDCNAYLPAIMALQACKKHFSAGSLIVVDEHTIGGETRALEEFCLNNQIEIFSTGWKYPDGPRLYGVFKDSRST